MQRAGFLLNMKKGDDRVISPKKEEDDDEDDSISSDAEGTLGCPSINQITPCQDYRHYGKWLKEQFADSKHLPDYVLDFVDNTLAIYKKNDVLTYKQWDNYLFWMGYFDKLGVDKDDYYAQYRDSIIFMLTLWELLENNEENNLDYDFSTFFKNWASVYDKYKQSLPVLEDMKPPSYKSVHNSPKVAHENSSRRKTGGSRGGYITIPPGYDPEGTRHSQGTISSRKSKRSNKHYSIRQRDPTRDSGHRSARRGYVLGHREDKDTRLLHRHPDRDKSPIINNRHTSPYRTSSKDPEYSKNSRVSVKSLYSRIHDDEKSKSDRSSMSSKKDRYKQYWDPNEEEVDFPDGYYPKSSHQEQRSARYRPFKSCAKYEKVV